MIEYFYTGGALIIVLWAAATLLHSDYWRKRNEFEDKRLAKQIAFEQEMKKLRDSK